MHQIPRDEYDALKALNYSRLKLIGVSPAHYVAGYAEESASLTLGTAAHMAVLEPERFESGYVIYHGRRAGKAWEAWETEQLRAGKSILNEKEHAAACAIRDAVHANATAHAYLQGGAAEQTLTWELAGGFKCKGRADYIQPAALIDLKSTQCAEPKSFANSAARYSYFAQAAWYSDGYALSTGKRLPFVIIAVESAAPNIVQVYRIPESEIDKGREQYLAWLAKLDHCIKTGWWGGYSEEPELDLMVPEWSVTRE